MTPFREPEAYMRGFDARQIGHIVTSTNDISLVIDDEGVVLDVGFGARDSSVASAIEWVGKPWVETVTSECRNKISDLLSISSEDVPSPWRQVNHPTESGVDIPIMYRAVSRDDDGHLIVVGRDLRQISDLQQQLLDVQHSMERDYARLHQAETRYRMLFTLASEGILIIDSDNLRIVEANPAASEVLELPIDKLVGRRFPRGMTPESEDEVEALLTQVRAAGHAEDINVRLAKGASLLVGASLLRREDGMYFLIRISSDSQPESTPVSRSVLDVIQRSPEAFVVTDPNGVILSANDAFVELCGLGSEQQVLGQPLDSWVGRSGVDIEVLRKNLKQRTQVRHSASMVRPQFGEPIDVDISAVSALEADVPCLGFTLRHNIRSKPVTTPAKDRPLAQSLQDMTKLIGRVPLQELVRETSDIIERLCIEAALTSTDNNRASAAELLGLSRQSLYVKLRRYGFATNKPKNGNKNGSKNGKSN
ncbi:MAG TPA: transcriptional regulator PpsR [Xanthomonadales bacterium]|nr:transcriptional regulator PpsR [Xanthomonadales bacterium]